MTQYDRPNIVYLHSHDTGRHIQPYGRAVATPNLQALAEQGVLFRQAFCTTPTCSPSRASLLTGQYPHQCGMMGLSHRGFALNDYGAHIVNVLKRAGYTSALAGVQHLANMDDAPWRTIGYDRFLGDHKEAETVAASYLKGDHVAPFFLDVGFFEAHRPFPEDHAADDTRYVMPPAVLPDTPQTREDAARFNESLRILDRRMGIVLDALEESGLADNTLVICTTDHGPPFPRMKCSLEDTGTEVMLILRGPEGFTGGIVIDSMVTQLDLFPTICDIVGIDPPDRLEGKSLMPFLDDRDMKLHDYIFGETNFHVSIEPMRSVRSRRWKYIERFDSRDTSVVANIDRSLSKSLWIDNGWAEQKTYRRGLFDLMFDPMEQNNLAGQPEHAAVLEQMSGVLRAHMERTADPLIDGPLTIPDGSQIVDPDDTDPSFGGAGKIRFP